MNMATNTATDDMGASFPRSLDPDACWAAVVARDPGAADGFVYAVASTKIYCRPTCPSRRPRRALVEFFTTPDLAELSGFRPCRRCRPREGRQPDPAAPHVQRACAFLDARADEGPVTLAAIARHVGVAPPLLQRGFVRLLGISPRQYAAARRAERFRERLRSGGDVSAAVYDAGYGSISRVYEQPPTGRGLTPAQYRDGAPDVVVRFELFRSPLGRLLVAGTGKGVCAVKLGDDDVRLEEDLRREFPRARIERDPDGLREWAGALVEHMAGRRPHLDVPVDVQATAFQWRVWRALQRIPYGETRTYSDVARQIGRPSAVRAVARACASNRVALVIPCHRVVPKQGGTGGYRWGVSRKQKLLTRERTDGTTRKP